MEEIDFEPYVDFAGALRDARKKGKLSREEATKILMKYGFMDDDIPDGLEELESEGVILEKIDDDEQEYPKAIRIVDYVKRHSTATNNDLVNAFGLSLNQADRILRNFKTNAFGPEGKGYVWFIDKVKKLLLGGK
jgi:hypothetical protein